jgi:integrase
MATRMRQGELLALRWCDVDLDTGALTVAMQERSAARMDAILAG